MSTITEPGAFDALEKAEPDEPLFPLLAHDECAPAAITEWARLRRNRAFNRFGESDSATDKELLVAELKQCAEAEAIALAMGEWRTRNAASPEGGKATYNEVIKSTEQLVEADRRKRREAAVRHLREAAYHVSEARDVLSDMALIGEATQRDLVMMLARINGLADEHQAKRADHALEPTLPIGAA